MAQPILIVSCEHEPMLLYVNGRFCGELDTSLTLPVSPSGTVFLQAFPMSGGSLPIARRLDFQTGELNIPAETLDSLSITAWPGGFYEVEFHPASVDQAPEQVLDVAQWGDETIRMVKRGNAARLESDHGFFHALPPGGDKGVMAVQSGLLCVTGTCRQGVYLILAAQREEGIEVLLDVAGDSVSFSDDGKSVEVREKLGDLVGHGIVRSFAPQGIRGAWMEVRSQRAWVAGEPSWPASMEETVRALLEALALNLADEAAFYLAEGYILGDALQTLGKVDGWVKLKYPIHAPGPVQMGVIRRLKAGYEKVEAFNFTLRHEEHAQGAYRIEGITKLWG